MSTTTTARRSVLVMRWVTVTDIHGRSRAEMRWTAEPIEDTRSDVRRAA